MSDDKDSPGPGSDTVPGPGPGSDLGLGGPLRRDPDLRAVLTGDADKTRAPMPPWLTGLALLSVAVFAGIVWYAYRTGNNDDGPPPLIHAAPGPAKVAPKEPGGMDVPNQDKLVYDELADDAPAETEELLADAEEPAPRPGSAPAVSRAVPSRVAKFTRPVPPVAPPAADSGAFAVQLGAFRGSATAARGWDGLVARYPAVLDGLSHDIMTAKIPGKGTYYRLRAGPFDSRDAAGAVCRALKDRGQGCLIVKP